MAKVTLDNLATTLANSAAAAINQNNDDLEAAFENTLSRDGTGPNQMLADFDMNNNDILNVKDIEAESLVLNGQIVTTTLTALPPGVMTQVVYDPQGKVTDAFESNNHDFLNSGTGVVERSVRSHLRDTLSVKDFGAAGDGVSDDGAEIALAVTEAIASGRELFWPAGTYLTSANIPSLHSVKHKGPGVIKRGADLFSPQPKEGQVNTLYVATGGSSLNDGLNSSQPFATLQNAFDSLKFYWPLDGKWVIRLAAGTYSTSANRTARLGPANENEIDPGVDSYTANGMAMKNMLVIQGPDVGYSPATLPTPTPTAIFEGGGAAAIGIQIEPDGLKVLVKDVKFQNYNGSSASAGISADGGCWIRTENVHATSCSFGIRAVNHSRLEVKGGTILSCTTGIQTLFLCKQEIGNQGAGAIGQGPFITSCTTGFHAQEGCTGHSDYVTYSGNGIAIDAQVNSRVNTNGSDFKLNTVAIRASNSNILIDTATFNTGTGNANTENIRVITGGQIPTENANTWRTIDRTTTAFTTAASTSVQTAYTATLLADRYTSVPSSIYRGKAIKFRCAGTITGTAGTKAFQMRIGGTLVAGVSLDADNNGSFEVEGHIYLTGSATQKNIIRGISQIGTNRAKTGYTATTINTASATDLSFTGTVQLGNSADRVVVEVMELEIQG